jgi:hypothetical protein
VSTEAVGGLFVVHYATDIGEFTFRVTTLQSAEWWAAFLQERWGDRTWVTDVAGKETKSQRAEESVAQLSLLE